MASSRSPEEEPLRSPFRLTPPPALGDEYYPFGGEGQPPYVGEAAAAGAAGEGDSEEVDLGVLLQRKEQDLLLAAELGKMLLERNEELERRYDELMKEHLEVKEHLEQEKHELRRHLESGRAEFETRTAELEADLVTARVQLGQKRLEQQDTSRESSQAVLDLSEQNQRLVEQLSQVTHLEQQLQENLIGLRAEHRTLTLCNAEHAARVQSLQAENRLLQERKQDMEKQIRQLREENEAIQALVDTLHENLLLLRKESSEKQLRVEAEAEELRTANRRLQHQVKDLKEEIRLHELDTSVTSIQSEIESSLGDAPGAPGQTPKVKQKDAAGKRTQVPFLVQPGIFSMSKDDCNLYADLRDKYYSNYQLPKIQYHLSDGDFVNADSVLVVLQMIVNTFFPTRKGEIELELAKISLERDSLSQQLLRVIRQKMALSQELEAWQVSKQISEPSGNTSSLLIRLQAVSLVSGMVTIPMPPF
uniref:BICD family-like cargo adapter 2 n=1 Tax=Pseudonaja textilis TaxID=8673 RepID=A0A670YLM7_PSETE